MAELLKRTPLDFIRYKYDEINWNGRLIGIVGPRGVGKSTMILQRIKLSKEGHHLYVSADNIYFQIIPWWTSPTSLSRRVVHIFI